MHPSLAGGAPSAFGRRPDLAGVAVAVILTAAVLSAFHNIHGAALAVGLALGLALALPGASRRPGIDTPG